MTAPRQCKVAEQTLVSILGEGRMMRRILSRIVLLAVAAAPGWCAAPAAADWRLSNTTFASVLYNQGITFDQVRGDFFLDGVTSTSNSGLYRTDSDLSLTAADFTVIPGTTEGYNHAGDLSFDPLRRRILLPFECYYPANGGNTCGVGAIGVADPTTLGFLYYVNLAPEQIAKAMWVEASPDGRWIWTSSGTHLLVYRASDVNPVVARQQRAGTMGGIVGEDLGAVLPTDSVTGASFYTEPFTHTRHLLLALNRGTYSEIVSYELGQGRGTPRLTSHTPTSLITVPQSFFDHESEGLAMTRPLNLSTPLGGVLHWQMLPVITLLSLYSRILTYSPSADDAHGVTGQARSARRTSPHLHRVGGPALRTAEQLKMLVALRQH
ncbi:MAG: hypothetical protein ACXVH1_39690 [Solirubrobacteraceae bacterium]